MGTHRQLFYSNGWTNNQVEKINLIGVESFKHDKILKLMEIDKGKIFKPDELEAEVQKIELFYFFLFAEGKEDDGAGNSY